MTSSATRTELPLHDLIAILGDQLDVRADPVCTLDPAWDRLWMAEVPEESTHVWSHKARSALFLAAIRTTLTGDRT